MPMRHCAGAAGFVSADWTRRGAFERAKAGGAVNGAAGIARRDDIGSRQAIPHAAHTVSSPWGFDGVNGKRLNIICINLIFRALTRIRSCRWYRRDRQGRHSTGLPAFFASVPAQLHQPTGFRGRESDPILSRNEVGESALPVYRAEARAKPVPASALREEIGADLPRVALPSIAFYARQVFGQVYYGLREM